jgi:hypothetical protein
MSVPPRPAGPRPLNGVDAGLDGDLVGEMTTVPTIRARRSAAAKVGHAGYGNPVVIALRLQSYVLAGAAPGLPKSPGVLFTRNLTTWA